MMCIYMPMISMGQSLKGLDMPLPHPQADARGHSIPLYVCEDRRTHLFRRIGAEDDGMIFLNQHFILYPNPDVMILRGKLGRSGDVNA